MTIKNQDAEDRKIIIRDQDQQIEAILKPSETASNPCLSGCDIETADGYIYDFERDDAVVIIDGIPEIAASGAAD